MVIRAGATVSPSTSVTQATTASTRRFCRWPSWVLLDATGREIAGTAQTLQLTQTMQTFRFEGIKSEPVPSLLRDFSAPVLLDFSYTPEQLAHLLAHEQDSFNAWEAGQRLATQLILAATAAIAAGEAPAWPQGYVGALHRLLAQQAERGAAFVAEALSLPGEATLADLLDEVNPAALHAARNGLRLHLAQQLQSELAAIYTALAPQEAYQPTAEASGRRALRNVCLGYLLELDTPEVRQLAWQQYKQADNMTDQYAALSMLTQFDSSEREQALADFYQRWQHEALVVDKWLAAQAGSRLPNTLAEVKRLTTHPAFDLGNPNKVYALLRGFGANHVRFHAADGVGYAFLAEQIALLDARNPQVASRLARCFDRWKKFDAVHQAHSRRALERLRDQPGLSRDVFEIVTRALV